MRNDQPDEADRTAERNHRTDRDGDQEEEEHDHLLDSNPAGGGKFLAEQEEVARHQYYEAMVLPQGLDYREVHGLSIEAQQRLNLQKPETIGHASRISGITPADISLLLVHLKRGFRTSWAGNEDAK